jgi:hypothetical protein
MGWVPHGHGRLRSQAESEAIILAFARCNLRLRSEVLLYIQFGPAGVVTSAIESAYDAINQFSSSANSTYNGTTVSLNRQFTEDFQLLAGYTCSKTIDDGSSTPNFPLACLEAVRIRFEFQQPAPR